MKRPPSEWEKICANEAPDKGLKVKVKSLSPIWLFATPWTATHQAPLSRRFPRQRYWSGLLFPSPGDLPNSGMKPRSSAPQADFLLTKLQGKPYQLFSSVQFSPVAQTRPTLFDPMNRSTPGLPVHHQLLPFTKIHVHRVSDAIWPSHPLCPLTFFIVPFFLVFICGCVCI